MLPHCLDTPMKEKVFDDMSLFTARQSAKKQLYPFINTTVNKKELNKLLSSIYTDYGTAKIGQLANSLKNLGFRYATMAGVTISIEDLEVPEMKKALMAEAESTIETATQRYLRGEITEVERYTKVIDTWAETNERLTQEIVDNFNRLNPIYMMAFSGARGNLSQVRQLVGMRGLMADSQGQIIDLPIKANFREGLSVTEYIISSYGARKGLVDTALKTADSGYLTRRLVDVAQDVIITEEDCGTTRGVLMKGIGEGINLVVQLEDRIISRTAAVDVVNDQGDVLVPAGDVITPHTALAITEAGITEVLVRSGLTCETNFGICRKCYGWSLTTNKLVDMGEAIGIMAAQSIGEPGTQLTMRTFHTGGVFSGFTKRELITAIKAGKVVKSIPKRDFRTRHGDVVDIATRDSELVIQSDDGKTLSYAVPYNATLYVSEAGATVAEGQLMIEYEAGSGRGDMNRLTEKATKDITSDISGKVLFEGFDADEKRDRQGNISRTSNRGGTIWVLGGDVYNLPTGSQVNVADGQLVQEGDVMAETTIHTEFGGEIRIPEDLETEIEMVSGQEVPVIKNGKELTVIIASITPANASLVQTKKELIWKVEGSGSDDEEAESFIIKAPSGTVVENGSILAELMDESCHVPTSGEIRYDNVEVDEQLIIQKPGKVFFIPEEIHQVSKDISLKAPGIESGSFVKAGTELVSGISARIDGVVNFVEENDIIHEVIIRPGKLYRVNDVASILVDDGTIVEEGAEVAPGVVATEKAMITITFQIGDPPDDADAEDLEDTSSFEYAEVLVRPVYEYEVGPRRVNIEFASTENENIQIVPVTQMQYQDGSRIRHVEGASLLRTSMVLQMHGYLSRIKGQTEIVELGTGDDGDDAELRVVVLENLTIRRDVVGDGNRMASATKIQLLVKHGDIVDKKVPVVKTQVLAGSNATVMLPRVAKEKDIHRILLITGSHLDTVTLKGDCLLKEGEFVRVGQSLDNKGTAALTSGVVQSIDKKTAVIHKARPYLISSGSQLQAEHEALAQQGDLIASLIFERQKTGDIVQGLPKVEELLEGRKPKEIALLAPFDATVEIVWDDDLPRLFITNPDHGRVEATIPVGANLMVEDKQMVKAGQQLTDGSINPHDLLEISGIEAVRQFLVDEVQRVYRSQGVEIADKHVEIIVRQMTRKVQIDDSGDTYLLGGEMVDMKLLNEANTKAEADGTRLSQAHYVLLGITKASLNTESFISAASFQETTRVLTEAAVEGRTDILRGLKENVIIGRLIPAGTGFFNHDRPELAEEESLASRSNARKPSAILEEIESMFGSPDVESMADFLLDDTAPAALASSFILSDGSFDDEDFDTASATALGDDDLIG
jgi:DNA-directed RNA polymerase subunit beta'